MNDSLIEQMFGWETNWLAETNSWYTTYVATVGQSGQLAKGS